MALGILAASIAAGCLGAGVAIAESATWLTFINAYINMFIAILPELW
jgi:hypothetical protein